MVQAAIAGSDLDLEVSVYEYPIDRRADWDAIVASAMSVGIGVLWVEGSCESTLVPLLEAADARAWRPMVPTTSRSTT